METIAPAGPDRHSRTRRAVLCAAASVLARNRTASLADIADAAQVGRSTLRRHFTDRNDLIRAVIADSYRVLRESVQEAKLDEGPPLAAMRRLVTAMVDAGDRLLFLYAEPRAVEEYWSERDPGPVAQLTIELIRRGQAEGVFDSRVSPDWLQYVLWTLVLTGCEAADAEVLPRPRIAATVLLTFENGIVAGPRTDRDTASASSPVPSGDASRA